MVSTDTSEEAKAMRPGMERRGRLAGARALAFCVAVALLIAGCATPAHDPQLTPAQNELRMANARWNNTVATGALTGAGAGVAGCLAARMSIEQALICAAIGAAVGAVAGAAVADRNYTFANRAASAQSRIESATATANALEAQSSAAQQVVAQHRRQFTELDRQFRARQITAAEYRDRAQPARQDLEQMREGARNGAEARQKINAVSGDLPQLRAQEARIGPAQRRLEGSAAELEDMLRRVPAV
jgi:hypothetical protein